MWPVFEASGTLLVSSDKSDEILRISRGDYVPPPYAPPARDDPPARAPPPAAPPLPISPPPPVRPPNGPPPSRPPQDGGTGVGPPRRSDPHDDDDGGGALGTGAIVGIVVGSVVGVVGLALLARCLKLVADPDAVSAPVPVHTRKFIQEESPAARHADSAGDAEQSPMPAAQGGEVSGDKV